jgi:hypothetical protein
MQGLDVRRSALFELMSADAFVRTATSLEYLKRMWQAVWVQVPTAVWCVHNLHIPCRGFLLGYL